MKSLLSSRLQTKGTQPAGMSRLESSFQLINGRLVSIEDNQISYINNGYNINDIIYSIVKLIMDKIRVAPWNVYTVKDEQSLKALWGMQTKGSWSAKDNVIYRNLMHKALEVATNPGKWGELMKYANEYETTSEFIANGCGYRLLLGNKFIWGAPLKGGVNAGIPNGLYNLPAQYVQILADNNFPIKVTGYNVQVFNKPYPVEEILHEKEWNPNWNINGQQLYGVSPLRAALKLTNRDNSSLDASTSRFQNNGISGILHMDNKVGNVDGIAVEEEIRRLKKTMVTEWQGERNQGKIGLSGYNMGWIPIGLTSEEMQQIENEKWNLRRLCSVFGVSSQLLNDPDNNAEANVEEKEKALTTRAALPHLTSTRDNLNRKGRQDWGLKSGQIIDFDMSVYSELQTDTEEQVRWLTPLMDRGLPLNRALELLNLETIKNPYYDLPRVTMAMGTSIDEHEENAELMQDALTREDDTEEDI